MDVYPLSGQEDHPCRFQACWFRNFPWLEYSLEVHDESKREQMALGLKFVDKNEYNLNMIVNVVCSFCKHNDELQVAYVTKISHLVANDEIETGKEANQIGTIQKFGDTRWSSHLNSICSLLRMYNATILVLDEDLAAKGSTSAQREFSNKKKIQLEYELRHYEFDVPKDVNFQSLSTIGVM
ncbi:hypothetical protein GmHk_16G046897 [Glycine max]|nr:hypothetical protein GmHk_16G046897 [Glycine max]